MKNKKYILLSIGISLLSLSSCSFLDTESFAALVGEPQDQVEQASAYKTATDAQREAAGLYENFRNNTFQFDLFGYNDIQSDNCYHGGDGVPGEEMDAVKLNPDNDKVKILWNEYFKMVGDANIVIDNTELMDSKSIDPQTRNKIVAEGKFVRAYAYLDLVRIYGDVPLLLKMIPAMSSENLEQIRPLLYPMRAPKEEVYDQIVKDLNEAIPHLASVSKGSSSATKGAAYLLLAKAYASRSTKSSRDYNQVVAYCNKVIGEGYQLVNEFDDLWKPEIKFTSESIFEVNYENEKPNWAYWVLFSEADGQITWRRYCTPTHELITKYTANDKRFESSIVYKSVDYDTHYPKGKYPISNKIRNKVSNIKLLRLADALLLKAEALVELNNVSEAMTIVNMIRKRAGLSDITGVPAQGAAREIVELERQLELYMEGHRWFDLLRNERVIPVMTNHKYKDGKLLVPVLEEFRLVWPVPQNEKDSNPNLVQNTGY
ncbi:RagB/SusD family nutrient uptake outer membrane protein [Sphingobacterium tabacisoli]|uniref:RagB/SusD family nutrient uptake outer membrane protein n=1 Tax=Sphingobacterium tabacisoli TaxID=2044855 RepID=A0ABW5L266_9SPHI|nr:RagB/SusD family nutrient uptake outer membrane protein [Sphingobacterium tabacisoli]